MLKTYRVGALLCILAIALSVTAYAEDNETSSVVDSVYADNREDISATVNGAKAVEDALQPFGATIDSNTIMPLYSASLIDFAETGRLDYLPFTFNDTQVYMSATVDSQGGFGGNAQFTANGESSEILMFAPNSPGMVSVSYDANADRISRLMKKKSSVPDTEAKLMFVEGLGYVYYIDDGTAKALISAGFKGTNGDIFNDVNGGIVYIDDALRKMAEAEVQKRNEFQEYLASLPPGENPATGGVGAPAFVVTDSTANEHSHHVLYIVTLISIGLTSTLGAIYLIKRRSNRNHSEPY